MIPKTCHELWKVSDEIFFHIVVVTYQGDNVIFNKIFYGAVVSSNDEHNLLVWTPLGLLGALWIKC